jgi:hypothetical protein
MRPLIVVVPHVLVQNPFKVTATSNQHLVQTLLSNRPYPPLGECVGVRCLDRRFDDLDAVGGKDVVEGARELAVRIANEEPSCAGYPLRFLVLGSSRTLMLAGPPTARSDAR